MEKFVIFNHERIRNVKSGYCQFSAKEDNKKIICEGMCIPYTFKAPLKIIGNYNGDKFICDSISLYSRTYEDFCEYLSTDKFPNAGYIQASKIYDKLKDPFAQILNIDDYKNFTVGERNTIIKLKEILYFEKLFNYLTSLGFNMQTSSEIFERFGLNSLDAIRNNPYTLYYAKGDFSICEKIALKNEFKTYDEKRIKALVSHAMSRNENNGNTRIKFDDLCNTINRIEDENYHTEDIFIAKEVLSDEYKVVNDNDTLYVYTSACFRAETLIADNIKRLNHSKKLICSEIPVADIEKECNVEYSENQKDAFKLLRESGLKIITGYPGTGKTTLLNGLIHALTRQNKNINIALCAPTGRAASKMAQSTKRRATTIHKLLDIKPFEDIINTTAKRLDYDCVIVDETSMLDIFICARLLSSIKNGALVLFIGDDNQLPSVGAGDILRDLISSGKIEYVKLSQIFRQDNENPIITNSLKIINGNNNLKTSNSFKIKYFANEKDMTIEAISLAKDLNNRKANYNLFTPTRRPKFLSSSTSLNKAIKDSVNNDNTIYFGNNSFDVGDRVIFLKNNYQSGYYNGLEGTITCIQKHTFNVYVSIRTVENEEITIETKDLENLDLGYALTAHKSQGGECDTAIIIIPREPKGMLQRKLLYVEVTRAKKEVLILSEGDALKTCISNHYEFARETGLKNML